MIRSYACTFAAVTARAWGPVLSTITVNGLVLGNVGVVLWPLNLLVAEWIIRSATSEAKVTTVAPA
jgi:hypothetical protein